MTQDPQSTTCIALRALGLALNFIRPALFSPFIKDQSYVAIEYMCFNTSLISIVMTYIQAKDVTSLASHVPWGLVVFAIIIITTVIFILLERAFYHFVTQLSMGKNLGYFGSFHQLLESFESWVASVWTAICCRGGGVGFGGGSGVSGGNVSAQLTKASPPPPYHQTMNDAALREDEKINIIV